MARTALIGHTGFVGSNILRSHRFDDVYNSSNIHEIRGRHYDLVVSAAGRADSHRINNAPAGDRAELEQFAATLGAASIDELVHVSSVCVYGAGDGADEDVLSDPADLTPYGRNRLWLEQTLGGRFRTLALRLPQLFGPGIKKGLVYDLANQYRVEFIRPDGQFQYYDLQRLWSDIEVARRAELSILNLATPPIEHRELANVVFEIELDESTERAPESPFSQMYTRNMTTKYAELFGMNDHYVMSRRDVIASIRRFVDRENGDAAREGIA